MQNLKAFYFSGTGNTRYVVTRLCAKLQNIYNCEIFDISEVPSPHIDSADVILLGFPIYGSAPPAPMRQFVLNNKRLWKGKKFIIVETQYMFSGDGAASLGRLVKRCGGTVCFAEHFNMPNNICAGKVFKLQSGEEIDKNLHVANARITDFAEKIKSGKPFRRGFNVFSHAVGYYCQRKWFRKNEEKKRGALKVDASRCIGCGLCAKNCPVGNLSVEEGKVIPQGNCALCYRCVNACPKKAISLLGDTPATQYKGIKT